MFTRRRIAVTLLIAASSVLAPIAVGAGASPFVPPSKAPAAPAPASDPVLDAIELSGISIIGDEQRFNLVDTRTKKSFWVELHATENGLTVESYNPEDDSVVVRHGDRRRRVELRRSVIVASGGAPRPAPLPGEDLPGVPPPVEIPPHIQGVDEIKDPKTPEEIKQAEFEARMLVSDLLQISMRERARRKALREQQAKQRAAAAKER